MSQKFPEGASDLLVPCSKSAHGHDDGYCIKKVEIRLIINSNLYYIHYANYNMISLSICIVYET